LFHSDGKVLKKLNKEEAKRSSEVIFGSNKITIQYKDSWKILGFQTNPNAGFNVWINDVLIKGSASHPLTVVETAKIALFCLAGAHIFNLLVGRGCGYVFFGVPVSVVEIIYVLFEATIFICLGLLTKRAPTVTLFIGSIYSILNLIIRYLGIRGPGGVLWFIFRLTCTVAVIKGWVAAKKLKSLNKNELKNAKV